MALEDRLKSALKDRIQNDVPDKFIPNAWLKTSFWDYYDGQRQLIVRVVDETTDGVLKLGGYRMSKKSRTNLNRGIKEDSTPEKTLPMMVDACSEVESIPLANPLTLVSTRGGPVWRVTKTGSRRRTP